MASMTPGKEFERKFIARVDRLPKLRLGNATPIEQGYLALSPNQVRIRRLGGGFIVELKGPGDIELELFRPDRAQGERLLHVAADAASIILKDRHLLPAGFDGLTWEIDHFRGANAPLVLIEIEMPRKNYPLTSRDLPDWLGPEVTKDDRFKNKNLAVRPFADWPKAQQKKVLKLMGL